MNRFGIAIACLASAMMAACHSNDPARIEGSQRCETIEKVRKAQASVPGSVGKVPLADAVFIGSVDRSGRGVLYDVECGYRLYGIAYANDGVERQLLAALAENGPPNAPLPKFYLWAGGELSFHPGHDYVFSLGKIVTVAPINDRDVPGVVGKLKAMKRLVPDAADF